MCNLVLFDIIILPYNFQFYCTSNMCQLPDICILWRTCGFLFMGKHWLHNFHFCEDQFVWGEFLCG